MAFYFAQALLATFRPESALIRAYRARSEKSPGLELALQYASRERKVSKLPGVMICPDPLPKARVAKSLFGPGSLILSQGLLSSFRDEEVVAVMRRGLALLSQRGASLKTLCSVWLTELERQHRKPWTPLRAIVLWSLLPLRNFLKRQDLKLNVFQSTQDADVIWNDAMRKVSSSERIFS